MMSIVQDKSREKLLFNQHAAASEYNVFSDPSNLKLIEECLKLVDFRPPGRVVDLGCGSGVFGSVLVEKGFSCVGVDIAQALITLGQRPRPEIKFINADVEALPLASASFDGVLLSGLIHHLPDPSLCATEVFRVLKPGGVFMAFDPNRMN